ncbi:MAG: flavodoxin family protein [Bacteroidetes bacterium]|nr:flavodoxin family protein [Bacteroidota bacterium]
MNNTKRDGYMQRLLVLNGSPRKKGNTSVLSEYLLNQLSSNYKTEQIFLYDYSINPCMDCRACKIDELECILEDGMSEIYKKIDQADVLIFGSPIYWFGPTAQTKMLIDRFRPYFSNKKLEKKKAAIVLPAGTGSADCDLTTEMFKRVFDALDVDFMGVITSKSYDVGDAYNDKKAMKNVELLAQKLL